MGLDQYIYSASEGDKFIQDEYGAYKLEDSEYFAKGKRLTEHWYGRRSYLIRDYMDKYVQKLGFGQSVGFYILVTDEMIDGLYDELGSIINNKKIGSVNLYHMIDVLRFIETAKDCLDKELQIVYVSD